MRDALVHAHNDYLEYFSELGIVGFGLLAPVLLILVDSFLTWANGVIPKLKAWPWAAWSPSSSCSCIV